MNDLERATILAYTESGTTPFVCLSPDFFSRAQALVRRLLVAGLDPSDILYPSMPACERKRVLALVERLRHHVAQGHIPFVQPPESTT